MARKIFVVEDNTYTAEDMCIDIKYALFDKNITDFDIVIANSIDEANDKLKHIDNNELICIIADLNMNPEGLTETEKQATQGTVLTGWVWLYSHVWENHTELRDKNVIFYSAFISNLKKDSTYNSIGHEQSKKIKSVDKNEYGINKLCNEIISIIKRS